MSDWIGVVSVGGGLTLSIAVDQIGLTDIRCVVRRRPRITVLT